MKYFNLKMIHCGRKSMQIYMWMYRGYKILVTTTKEGKYVDKNNEYKYYHEVQTKWLGCMDIWTSGNNHVMILGSIIIIKYVLL